MTKAAQKVEQQTNQPLEGEVVEPSTDLAVQSARLMDKVVQLASTPEFDIEKLERLISLHDDMKASVAKNQYAEAMSRVQARLESVRADEFNKETRSPYATMMALDEACRRIYAGEGFSLEIDTKTEWYEGSPYLHVIGTLTHAGGHSATKSITVPADGKGAKGGDVMTKTHATMSALTYGRKAILEMFFNLSVDKSHDDDGNAAGRQVKGQTLTGKQIKEINTILEKFDDPKGMLERILTAHKVKSIAHIPSKRFDNVKNHLNRKLGGGEQ